MEILQYLRIFIMYWCLCALVELVGIYKVTGFFIKGSRTLFIANAVLSPLVTPFHIFMIIRGTYQSHILDTLEREARKANQAKKILDLETKLDLERLAHKATMERINRLKSLYQDAKHTRSKRDEYIKQIEVENLDLLQKVSWLEDEKETLLKSNKGYAEQIQQLVEKIEEEGL